MRTGRRIASRRAAAGRLRKARSGPTASMMAKSTMHGWRAPTGRCPAGAARAGAKRLSSRPPRFLSCRRWPRRSGPMRQCLRAPSSGFRTAIACSISGRISRAGRASRSGRRQETGSTSGLPSRSVPMGASTREICAPRSSTTSISAPARAARHGSLPSPITAFVMPRSRACPMPMPTGRSAPWRAIRVSR